MSETVGGHAFGSLDMVGGHWLGTLGSAIPPDGEDSPSPFYDDSPNPLKYYRALNVTIPSGCSIFWYEDGSCLITVPDLDPYEFVFEAYENNASYGQQSIFVNYATNVTFEAGVVTVTSNALDGSYSVNASFEAGVVTVTANALDGDVDATGFIVTQGGDMRRWIVSRKIYIMRK